MLVTPLYPGSIPPKSASTFSANAASLSRTSHTSTSHTCNPDCLCLSALRVSLLSAAIHVRPPQATRIPTMTPKKPTSHSSLYSHLMPTWIQRPATPGKRLPISGICLVFQHPTCYALSVPLPETPYDYLALHPGFVRARILSTTTITSLRRSFSLKAMMIMMMMMTTVWPPLSFKSYSTSKPTHRCGSMLLKNESFP